MLDSAYREFMNGILTNLEPIMEERGQIILGELDEANIVTFVDKGTVGLGYEINKIKKVHFTFKNNCVVGAFEAIFYQRSSYIWVAMTNCHGNFIRKEAIISMLDEYPEVGIPFKRNLLMRTILKI